MSEAVEVERPDGTTPGLVIERRTDGTAAEHQERVVVATVQDGEVREIDTAAERTAPATDPQLVRDVVESRLEGEP